MITFQSLNIFFRLKEIKKVRSWVYSTIINEKKELEFLSIIFCSDEEILRINKESLNHDYYTDIITFELNEMGMPIEGDLFISIDRIKENAKKLDVRFEEELKRVIIHGVLHLCGYKDKKKLEKEIMTKKENYYLKRYGVSRGTK